MDQGLTDCFKSLCHNLRAVVNCQYNICDTGGSESLDLMLDHRLVGELNEGLGVGEGLEQLSVLLGVFTERKRIAYERSQTGTEPSDENDCCMACQSSCYCTRR